MSHPMLKDFVLNFVYPATGILGGTAIFYHISERGTKVPFSAEFERFEEWIYRSPHPLRAENAKPKIEERIDETAHPLRAENAKPKDSMSNEMKKIEQLCARIDKVEVELRDTKTSIKELALGFQDLKLDMERSLLLQRNEIFKK